MVNAECPWLCGKCGYSLQGLGDDSACPECGSVERVLNLAKVFRVSNLKYACVFTSAACLIFAVSLGVSAFGMQNAYYGLSSWWLLLGWLAGAVIYFVGVTTLSNVRFNDFARQKLAIRFLIVICFLGTCSALLLFKGTYKGGFGIVPASIKIGLYISPAIALTSATLPALLGLHFKSVNRTNVAQALFITAGCLLICASGVIGLYLLVWLDWTIGIGLYLSEPGGYTVIIPFALKTFAVLGSCASLYGFIVGIRAYQSVK